MRLVFGYPASGGLSSVQSSAPSCPWGTYSNSANVFPGAACYPYDPGVWINRPLGASPTVASYSAAVVAYLKANYNNTVEHYGVEPIGVSYNDYAHPPYFSTANDPVYTIVVSNPPSYPETAALSGQTLHAPTGMVAAAGTDNHLIVIDQTTNIEWDMWQCNPTYGGINDGARTLGAHAIGKFSLFGEARIVNSNTVGNGANASNTALYAGQIRGVELQAGLISHPLSSNFVNCSTGAGLVPAHVYPATGNGRQSGNTDPAMGQFVQYTGPIETLGVPEWKKVVLRAARDYGVYMDDTGADGNIFQLRVESGKGYHAYGLENPAVTFAQANFDGTHITQSGGVYYYEFGVDVNWIDNIRVIDPAFIQAPH